MEERRASTSHPAVSKPKYTWRIHPYLNQGWKKPKNPVFWVYWFF
jgi:hypothetical protein